MRRIYIAGRYSRRDEFNFYAGILRGRGATIDARWLTREPSAWSVKDIRRGIEGAADAGRIAAIQDFGDVCRANMLLSFTEDDDAGYTSGGRHVEYGIAYTMGLTLAIVGPRENVFHCFGHEEQFDDFDAFERSIWLSKWLSTEGIR